MENRVLFGKEMGSNFRQVKTTEMVSKDIFEFMCHFTETYPVLLTSIKLPFIFCHNTFYFLIIALIFV